MKTKNLFRLTFLVLAIIGLSLSGCKKDKNSDNTDATSLQQLAGDEETMESAMDESMNDVNNYLSGGNLKSTSMVPCNATVDSTAVVNDTITIFITYNGVNCSGTRYRAGRVEIKKQVGTLWFQEGATVSVKHINFLIAKTANNTKFITLNGVKIYKNISGGLIWQLGNGINTIVHRTYGHLNITFNDGTSKTWNIARQKTYSGVAPYNLTLSSDGFGVADGYENLVTWGVNRQGENFYTQILESVTRNQVCNWDPSAGIKKHSIPADNKSATITFGYDENNQPIGNECPSKYKVDWQKNNKSGTVYLWL